MLLLYIVAYLDRINISFAGLEMNRDLGFTPEIFGLGSGVFFVGYFLFGVPSNVMVARLGARKWIALIMVCWGMISVSFSAVRSVEVFCLMRFLLGVAEAGFFPGMILYLTFWFPRRLHAQAVSRFMTAIPLAGILGGVVSSQVLQMHGLLGLPGWKWLFIITGSPAILLGVVVFFFLSDGPRDCRWLTEEERTTLANGIAAEQALTETSAVDRKTDAGWKPALPAESIESPESTRLADSPGSAGILPASGEPTKALNVFLNGHVWILALLYFLLTLGMYGFQLWLPQIIGSIGHRSDSVTALISAIPAVFQAIGMVLIGRNSDRTGERRFHVAACAWLAAGALVLCSMSKDPVFSLVCLCICAFGLWGGVGPFWSIPTTYLSAGAAAAGIGLINSVGNLGGFAGPYLVGFVRQRNPDFMYSLIALAIPLVVAGFLVLTIKKKS